MIYVFAALAVFAVFIYLLYRQGFAVTKSIAAILFIFRPERQADRVSLDTCTGWVRHVGRFHESRIYEFHLNCQLSNGDAEATLLNSQMQALLHLSRNQPTEVIELEKKSRYYLQWDFQCATGKCELCW